nr:MAG: replication associated protein [Smacoviridae sp.]
MDYMAFALAHTEAKAFVFDIPRSDDGKREKQMWSAIEQIKNGYLYDKRNTWREAWIDPPKILVFTNSPPNKECLSKDRWRTYWFDDTWKTDYLVPYGEGGDE